MRGRFLFSHLPFDDALALAKRRPLQTVDDAAFRAWWEASQLRKAAREPAWAAPVERDLPAGCEEYIADVMKIPQVAAIGPRPWAIKVVDLRHVVGFQVHVVEDRIRVPPGLNTDDPCAILRFTLRKPTKSPLTMTEVPGDNAITLSAPNVNLRVMGSTRGEVPLGPVVGFVIGGGIPWIQVVAFGGRHVLRDGYHRAVGLLRAGINEVPVARIEGAELADLGIQPGFLAADLVLGPQPPLLTDFLDDGLSGAGGVLREMKVIRISAQQFIVPILEDGTDAGSDDASG